MGANNVVHVIDPDQAMSRPLAALLGAYGISVKRHADEAGFRLVASEPGFDGGCLMLELDVSRDEDLHALRALRRDFPGLPIIVMSESTGDGLGARARDAGATDLIERPLAAAYLFSRLAQLLPGSGHVPQIEPAVMEVDGAAPVTLRMADPEDAEMEQDFMQALSEKSRYMRFFSGLSKLPEHVLKEFTTPRYPISYAVIATVPEGDGEKQIGVARWAPTGTEGVAEFAVVVADAYQGLGIASRLMRILITAAAVGGLQRLEGLILAENEPMLAMVKKMGFTRCPDHDAGPGVALYVKHLRDALDAQS